MKSLSVCFLVVNANSKDSGDQAVKYLLYGPDGRPKDSDTRVSALICTEDHKEVFAVELDGSTSGSIDEGIDVCTAFSGFSGEENAVAQATVGLLRAIKKLQEAE